VQTTGRQVVVFADDGDDVGVDWSAAGISDVADSRDFTSGRVGPQALRGAGATVFARLGIAVVSAAPDQLTALRAASADRRPVLSVSPELVHHVLPEDPSAYVQGYRDGVADLAGRLVGAGGGGGAPIQEPNRLRGRVRDGFYLGEARLYQVEVGGALLQVKVPPDRILAAGEEVCLHLPPARCRLLSA
jgi:hypothetical protein